MLLFFDYNNQGEERKMNNNKLGTFVCGVTPIPDLAYRNGKIGLDDQPDNLDGVEQELHRLEQVPRQIGVGRMVKSRRSPSGGEKCRTRNDYAKKASIRQDHRSRTFVDHTA